ncbi:MAG: energy transducer TonB [Deltaproteobacteria bacterium]|nr:energy transducer TonB [Deltaproteobacteria bacterium]
MRTKDPTGEIYLYKDRYTVVAVTLGNDGSLRSIAVDRSSGVDFLDREAISAFQRAQPFPNPPPALQNDRGEIRFIFGFYLEVPRGGLDLFRPAR